MDNRSEEVKAGIDSRVPNKRGKRSKKAVTSATRKAGRSPGDGERGSTERGFREQSRGVDKDHQCQRRRWTKGEGNHHEAWGERGFSRKAAGAETLEGKKKGGGEEIRKHFLQKEQFYLKTMEDERKVEGTSRNGRRR